LKRYLLVFLLIAMVLGVVACGSDSKKETPPIVFQNISPQQAYDKLSKSDNAVLVDVRNPEEWATGYAEGAVLISLREFEQRAPNELPKDAEIYVICRSGNRSAQASQTLIDLGYTKVYNIEGGTIAWETAQLPMTMP